MVVALLRGAATRRGGSRPRPRDGGGSRRAV